MNDENLDINDKSEIKSLNKKLIALAIIIVIWAVSVIMYVDKKASSFNDSSPIVLVDVDTGKVIGPIYTNTFNTPISEEVLKNVDMSGIRTPNNETKLLFEKKESYNIKEFVVISYFYIGGIITDKNGNDYTVMYKDHNHTLQKITITKDFLLSPTSQKSTSPAPLLSN